MHIITAWMTHRLAQLGYLDARPQYSLGYTQGSGACFTGNFSHASIKVIAKRLLKGQFLAAFNRALKKDSDNYGMSFKVEHRGNYSHEHSTSVEFDYSDSPHIGFTALELKAVEEFVGLINEDVVDVGRMMGEEGYKISEAGDPTWWRTNHKIKLLDKNTSRDGVGSAILKRHTIGRFTATVKLVEDNDWDAFEDMDTVAAILAGKYVWCGVVVTITDTATGGEWGENSLWGVCDTLDLKYIRDEVARDCLSEAITEARVKMKEMGVKQGAKHAA